MPWPCGKSTRTSTQQRHFAHRVKHRPSTVKSIILINRKNGQGTAFLSLCPSMSEKKIPEKRTPEAKIADFSPPHRFTAPSPVPARSSPRRTSLPDLSHLSPDESEIVPLIAIDDEYPLLFDEFLGTHHAIETSMLTGIPLTTALRSRSKRRRRSPRAAPRRGSRTPAAS